MVVPNGSKLESVQGKQDLEWWWGAPLPGSSRVLPGFSHS